MTDALLPGPSHAVITRLTITLDDVEPPVWRQLEVRGELTLDVVHELLQAAMGWENYHLHRFWRGVDAYQPAEPRFVTEIDIAEGEDGVRESTVRLDQVLREAGDVLGYLYDFGDDWQHTLTVDDVQPASGDEPAARCLDGRGACPPEDVGGQWTYSELVAALAATDPDAEQSALLDQYRDWLPAGFDPARFDPAEATAAMAAVSEGAAAVADLMSTPVVALRSLAGRLGGEDLALLAELARSAAAAPPTNLAPAVRPWQVLLDAVGTEGTSLTAAGRLRPVVVQELAQALGVDHWWPGRTDREDQTVPVARLRETARALRLVRKDRGRLVRTPAGRRVATDAAALAAHIAGALPLGRDDFEQEAGAVWLLCVAAGRDDAHEVTARLLSEAGWRIGADALIDTWAVRQGARATGIVLGIVVDAFREGSPREQTGDQPAAAPAVRALAARAVLGR